MQLPHDNVPPQPSEIAPQFLPACAQVVGTHAPGGVTVRVVFVTVPKEAVIVATTGVDGTPEVVAVKGTVVAPAKKDTNEGTVTKGLLLLRVTAFALAAG